MSTSESIENGITLREIVNIVLKKWLLIVLITLSIVGIVSVYVYKVATPIYESNTSIMIQIGDSEYNSGSASNASYNVSTSLNLVETTAYLLKNETLLDEVVRRLNLDITASSIKDNITVSYDSSSLIMVISYRNADPIKSKEILNCIIDTLIAATKGEVENIDSLDSLQESIRRIGVAKDGSYVSPNKLLYIIIGFVIGGVISLAVVFLLELFNTKIKNKDEVERLLGLQVIGNIPYYKEGK